MCFKMYLEGIGSNKQSRVLLLYLLFYTRGGGGRCWINTCKETNMVLSVLDIFLMII